MIREQVKIRFKRVAIAVATLAFLMLGFRCEPERPKDILSEKEMVKALQEIYLAEEKLSRAPIPYDSMRKVLPYLKNSILGEIDLTDSTFRKSWNYYLDHPDRLEVIYTALIDSLNLKEQGSPTLSPSDEDAVPD